MEQALLNQYIPYSQEAEEACLGATLVNGAAFNGLRAFLTAEKFFILRHQNIYQAMGRIHERGDAIDYLTVINELRAMGKLDEIGGAAYLTQLVNATPTSIHAEVYGRIVERAAARRYLLSAADRIKALALDEELTIESVFEQAHVEVRDSMIASAPRQWTTAGEAISRLMDTIEAGRARGNDLIGLDTGFSRLNRATMGWQPGLLYLVAGRPGMGKSAILWAWALAVAKSTTSEGKGRLVVGFSQEMNEDQIMGRLAASQTDVNTRRMLSGNIADTENRRFLNWIEQDGHKLNLVIDSTPNISPYRMQAVLHEVEQVYRQKVDLVVEDYLQLMASGENRDSREQEVAAISRGLKVLAMTHRVPVISAAQLNRAADNRADHTPTLADLRESGSLENDADVVIFPYCEDWYEAKTGQEPDVTEMKLIIAKHRNGPTGTIPYTFTRSLMQFVEHPREEHTNGYVGTTYTTRTAPA